MLLLFLGNIYAPQRRRSPTYSTTLTGCHIVQSSGVGDAGTARLAEELGSQTQLVWEVARRS